MGRTIIVHLNQQHNAILHKNGYVNILSTNKHNTDDIIVINKKTHITINNGIVRYMTRSKTKFYNAKIVYLYYDMTIYNLYFSLHKTLKSTKKNQSKSQTRLIDAYPKIKPVLVSKKLIVKPIALFIVLPLLTFFNNNFYIYINKVFNQAFIFLTNEPIGIKQNKIISLHIGKLLQHIFVQTNNQYYHKPILFIKTHLCSYIIVKLFSRILIMISQITAIFQGKNYNKLKKRTDRVQYKFDRVVLAAFLFAVLMLAVYNLIGYYLLFVGVRGIILVVWWFCRFIDFLMVDLSEFGFVYIRNERVETRRCSRIEVIRAAFIYACKGRFLCEIGELFYCK